MSRRRNGFTLIEMMVVIAVFSFVLVSASLVLSSLWRTHADLQVELASTATLQRLDRQLRMDSHLAESATISTGEKDPFVEKDPKGVLEFRYRGSSVQFRREPRRVVRSLFQSDQMVHREVFLLPEMTSCDWSVAAEDPALLRVSVTQRTVRRGADGTASRTDTIEANIGFAAGGRQ